MLFSGKSLTHANSPTITHNSGMRLPAGKILWQTGISDCRIHNIKGGDC